VSSSTRPEKRWVSTDQAARLMRVAGASKVIRMDWPPLILHVQSTMRMGSDPADSVLDANAEGRFVERLFISSNSALANGLGGPNPTLTTQALATRTGSSGHQAARGRDLMAKPSCSPSVRPPA
jgi:choline dehydrogenase-like flavoprotein